jgi:PIN domain nuclease of toxin-antitoxin system
LGKLNLSLPLKELVENQQQTNDLTVSPVELTHVLALDALPFHQIRSFQRIPLGCCNDRSEEGLAANTSKQETR